MGDGLRARLIGAWKLVAYRELPVDGSEPFEPMGHEPQGIIMYTPTSISHAMLVAGRCQKNPSAEAVGRVGLPTRLGKAGVI
jgi:hypothetical protein